MSLTDRLIATPAIAATGRLATRGRLRVFAMHGVGDVDAFEQQLDQLLGWFRPVDSGAVRSWLRGDTALPARAAWFTFDDGLRSTVVDAAPILERRGVRATVFVCPGLIEERRQPWWSSVAAAVDEGIGVELNGEVHRDHQVTRLLKVVPDPQRREAVESLPERHRFARDPVEVSDLHRWRECGGDIGNHTWDHPCLDQCTDEEQRRQIDLADDWLTRRGLFDHRIFAYPNGDRTVVAERHLAERRYEIVALFDHALAAASSGPLRVSRLRLDAGASAIRTAAVSSGWHSLLFGLRRRREGATRSGRPAV